VSLGVISGGSLVGICWIVVGILQNAGHGCRMLEQPQLEFTQTIQEQTGRPDTEQSRSDEPLGRLRSGLFGYLGLQNRAFSYSHNFAVPNERTPFIPTDNGSARKPDTSDHHEESDHRQHFSISFCFDHSKNESERHHSKSADQRYF
jgi:hypothetical protein